MTLERVCILCGRVIREGMGRSNYRKHVVACERLTPAQRIAATKAAERREEREQEQAETARRAAERFLEGKR